MKFLTICLTIFMSVALTAAQYFGNLGQYGSINQYNDFGFGFNAIQSDFGPSPFGGSLGNVRDARQDRGPVVFPPSPDNAPVETSGVIIGASGFGFVPPQNGQNSFRQRRFRYF